MTISSTTNRVNYTGNGVTTAFAFPYKFLANADLKIYVESVLATITTDYTVTGAGDDAGGTVTFLVAPANGLEVVILRDPAITQGLDLVENDPLPAEDVENAFDKLTMICQRLQDQVDRTLGVDDSVTSAIDVVIPTPDARKALIWNATSDGLINSTYDPDEQVTLAAASAVAASSSESTASAAASAAGVAQTAAEAAQTAAEAAAATIPAYDSLTGEALNYVRLNAGETTMEFRTPAEARTDLGLVIGTDVQAYDADIPTTAASQVEMEAGTESALRSMSPLRVAQAIAALATTSESVPVRQTVLSGPVDSSGFSAFGGSTGSTTVTASGTLKATAAAGGDANYTGSIVNPSWTGLSTNGTMFLYLDITSGGVVTTGSTTLEPTYQWGGTYSTTNLQNTFNIQEMTMKVGNGSTASQVYRVFVGEVTVAGSVVTAITWYTLMGRYDSGWTATLPNTATQVSKNSNIGTPTDSAQVILECTTTDVGYAVGDRIVGGSLTGQPSTNASSILPIVTTRNTVGFVTGSAGVVWYSQNKTSGAAVNLTRASWKYKVIAERGW